MEAVLGIDAAWTTTNPSGVAVAVKTDAGWQLVAAAESYESFLQGTNTLCLPQKHQTHLPVAADLLARATALAGTSMDVVAIDMPLSHEPITGRRLSDTQVSRAYGSRKCSTHSPSALRPGKISDNLRSAFENEGYPLATSPATNRGLFEVYPHPALVELMGEAERLRYKHSKIRNYWRELSPVERKQHLFAVWQSIIQALEKELRGTATMLPLPSYDAKGVHLKAFEDMLDAVICCYAGKCILEGRAIPYGDHTSAIWIPAPSPEVFSD